MSELDVKATTGEELVTGQTVKESIELVQTMMEEVVEQSEVLGDGHEAPVVDAVQEIISHIQEAQEMAKQTLELAEQEALPVDVTTPVVEVAPKEETLETAQTVLSDILQRSIIPAEYWDEIGAWLTDTQLDTLYLDGRDRIGAWWAAREVKGMGYGLNFPKSPVMPSEWCPVGDDWEIAEVEARYRLVASWQQLLDTGALERLEVLAVPEADASSETPSVNETTESDVEAAERTELTEATEEV